MKILFKFQFLVFLVFFISGVLAKEYHVSINGSDKNVGDRFRLIEFKY